MIHIPTLPLNHPPSVWLEVPLTKGIPGQEPDRWTATKRTPSGIIVHEVEFHHASITRGQKIAPKFDCVVTFQAPLGYELVHDCDTLLPDTWHPGKAAMRRVACYLSSRPDLRREALKEAAMPYTTLRWARGRLAYGPCDIPLPNLTAAQATQEAKKIAGWLARYRQILSVPGATGHVEDAEEGIFTRRDGYCPGGISKRGAEGGSGVFAYDGWEQAPLSPAYHWLKARCAHERWWHAYDAQTGAIVTADWYGDPGPMYQCGTGDPNNGWLPEFQGVAQHPDPIMETYDFGHSIRGWSDVVALSEMVDSPAVKRMLRGVAAQLRLQLSEIGPRPGGSGYTPPSLRTFHGWAENLPHNGHFGMDTGRQFGEIAIPIAQSVKRAGAVENIPWCEMFADFIDTAMMPNGMVSRCSQPVPPAGKNDVWYDPVHDLFHAFEVPLLMLGAIGAGKYSNRHLSNPLRWAESLYIEAPLLPYYSGHGPPQYGWCAARGGAPYDTIEGGKGGTGDSSHAHVGCALAAHLDPANRQKWIDAALRIEPISDFRKDAGLVAQMQRT